MNRKRNLQGKMNKEVSGMIKMQIDWQMDYGKKEGWNGFICIYFF